MSYEQTATLVILGATLTLFVWGRFRYDLVAFSALITGAINFTEPVLHHYLQCVFVK